MWYALLALVGVAAIARALRRRRSEPHPDAHVLGFHFDLSDARPGVLAGTYAGFRTRLLFIDRGIPHLDIEMSPVASGIVLSARATGDLAAGIATGDPQFDAEVVAGGSEATLLSLLDADARESLSLHARALQLRVEDGVVHATVVAPGKDAPRWTAALDTLALVAAHLVPNGPPAARLRERATKDPLPSVRRTAFEVFESALPSSPEARAAALAGIVDSDPGVALAAARLLGTDGHDALAALAANEILPVAVRVDAFDVLRARFAPDELRSVCRTLVKALRPAVRERAIATLAALGARELLPEIRARVQSAGGDPEEDRAIAEALGTLADDANEAPLLVLLRRDASLVRIAAARALGVCGSAAAIEALHAAGADSREVAPAAEQAVVAIRARLVGAAPGQLEIAGGTETGRLSVPAGAPGALAVALKREGRS